MDIDTSSDSTRPRPSTSTSASGSPSPHPSSSASGFDLLRPAWGIALGLGALALVRPVIRILLDQAGVELFGPLLPLATTALISLVWVLAAVLLRTRSPLATLTAAGIVYALLAIVLSGVLSPLLTGTLSGPLAHPFAILPMLLTNALWGLACGAIALGLQSSLHRRPAPSDRGAR
ncbi:hypothetical protein ACXET9_06075 [Brachybacterium sp. DNPG3]